MGAYQGRQTDYSRIRAGEDSTRAEWEVVEELADRCIQLGVLEMGPGQSAEYTLVVCGALGQAHMAAPTLRLLDRIRGGEREYLARPPPEAASRRHSANHQPNNGNPPDTNRKPTENQPTTDRRTKAMSTDTFEFVATDVPVLDSDTYLAALDRMELRQSKTTFMRDDGTAAPGEYYSWKFQLLDGDHDGEYVFANSSTSFGRRAKMRRWVAAILGREIQTGERLTHSDLLGVPCKLVVKKERDNEGFWVNIITDILPATPNSSNGTGGKVPPATQLPLEELFEDDEDDTKPSAAGLIRRFEVAKQKLGWKPAAYDTWCKLALGWTPKAIAEHPGPAKFHKLGLRHSSMLWKPSRRLLRRRKSTTKTAT